jgi:hypothetical protein
MALKGLSALDIDIETLSIQLYNTFSFQTSIKLFTNSSNGEEKMNLPLPKEFPLRTLARRVSQLRRVYKIKDRF